MTLQAPLSPELPPSIQMGDSPKIFRRIQEHSCTAAIWRRQALPSFQTWINALQPSQLPVARLILRPHAVCEAIGYTCDLAGTPAGPKRTMLAEDIAALAQIFASVTEAAHLRLRLSVLSPDSPAEDALEGSPVRLVCTYRGAGTEYGFGIQDVARSVPVSSVLMTRPCDTERQFWHRDPPVERVTDTRLQLTLDAVSEREAAPKTVH